MKLELIKEKLKSRTPTILGSEKFSKYAVLLPLIQKEDGIHVLFEVRSQELRRQPGEICFPGGKIDSTDTDEKEAAIRETIEELGVERKNISGVFPLDYMVSQFGMIVYPYAGFIDCPTSIRPNPAEVGEIFTVPVSFLLKTDPDMYRLNYKVEPEENFPLELIPGGENYKWRTRGLEEYFYNYEGKIIWGLTAKILYHFIEILRN